LIHKTVRKYIVNEYVQTLEGNTPRLTTCVASNDLISAQNNDNNNETRRLRYDTC